tara:strand:- start:268 stop:438 length:171 start_codon:yes stop_codon:yes gene_type:complete
MKGFNALDTDDEAIYAKFMKENAIESKQEEEQESSEDEFEFKEMNGPRKKQETLIT